jgi:hypothetical protein
MIKATLQIHDGNRRTSAANQGNIAEMLTTRGLLPSSIQGANRYGKPIQGFSSTTRR